jgi:hypothetical protein
MDRDRDKDYHKYENRGQSTTMDKDRDNDNHKYRGSY